MNRFIGGQYYIFVEDNIRGLFPRLSSVRRENRKDFGKALKCFQNVFTTDKKERAAWENPCGSKIVEDGALGGSRTHAFSSGG